MTLSAVAGEVELSTISIDLLVRFNPSKGVRLLGVTLSNLEAAGEVEPFQAQMTLAL